MLLVGVSDRALALDPVPAPAGVSIHTEVGWTLHAGMQSGMVVGFLASIPSSSVPGHTFSIIWLSKIGDGTWAWEGINAASLGHAALAIEARYGGVVLFHQPQIRGAADAVTRSGSSGSGSVTITPMANGLDLNDPFQSISSMLEPQTMEALVGFAAAGAVSLTALVVDQSDTCGGVDVYSVAPGSPSVFDRRLTGSAWRVEQIVAAAMNPDFTPDDPPAFVMCWPGDVCNTVTVPTCGLGIFAPMPPRCNYTCFDTITTSCVYVSCFCNPGPLRFTTVFSIPYSKVLPAGPLGTCP